MVTVERQKDRPGIMKRVARSYGKTGLILFVMYVALFAWMIFDEVSRSMDKGWCTGIDCFIQMYKTILLFLFAAFFLPWIQAQNEKAIEKEKNAPKDSEIWASIKTIWKNRKKSK